MTVLYLCTQIVLGNLRAASQAASLIYDAPTPSLVVGGNRLLLQFGRGPMVHHIKTRPE